MNAAITLITLVTSSLLLASENVSVDRSFYSVAPEGIVLSIAITGRETKSSPIACEFRLLNYIYDGDESRAGASLDLSFLTELGSNGLAGIKVDGASFPSRARLSAGYEETKYPGKSYEYSVSYDGETLNVVQAELLIDPTIWLYGDRFEKRVKTARMQVDPDFETVSRITYRTYSQKARFRRHLESAPKTEIENVVCRGEFFKVDRN